MDINKIWQFVESKKIIAIVAIFFSLALLAGTFVLGAAVGYHKARFSYAWGENYHRNFGGPRNGFYGNFWGKDLIEAHGTVGQIIKLDGPTIIVKGKDGAEKIILAKDGTLIRHLRDTIKTSDLKVSDYIIAIGDPNDAGQIEAKFIRVMPAALSSITPIPTMRH